MASCTRVVPFLGIYESDLQLAHARYTFASGFKIKVATSLRRARATCSHHIVSTATIHKVMLSLITGWTYTPKQQQ